MAVAHRHPYESASATSLEPAFDQATHRGALHWWATRQPYVHTAWFLQAPPARRTSS